jgi:hypothetical protein
MRLDAPDWPKLLALLEQFLVRDRRFVARMKGRERLGRAGGKLLLDLDRLWRELESAASDAGLLGPVLVMETTEEKADAVKELHDLAEEVAQADDLPHLFRDETFTGRVAVAVELLREAVMKPGAERRAKLLRLVDAAGAVANKIRTWMPIQGKEAPRRTPRQRSRDLMGLLDCMTSLERMLYPVPVPWGATLQAVAGAGCPEPSWLGEDFRRATQHLPEFLLTADRETPDQPFRGSSIAVCRVATGLKQEAFDAVRNVMDAHDAILLHYGIGDWVADRSSSLPGSWPDVAPLPETLLMDLERATSNLHCSIDGKPEQNEAAPARRPKNQRPAGGLPERPTTEFCLPRRWVIRWQGEKTVTPQLWILFEHLLTHWGEPVDVEDIARDVFPRTAGIPKRQTIRNVASLLTDALREVHFGWKVRIGGGGTQFCCEPDE